MCPLNERSGRTIDVECVCGGFNGACSQCLGAGMLTKLACRRCGGTGMTGAACLDCQGQGWRELDNGPLA